MAKKRKNKIKHPVLMVFSIILMLAALAAAVLGAGVSRSLTSSPDSFNELTPKTAYEGQIVGGQVFASLGTFGQMYKLDENGKIISETDLDYYYLIPVSDYYSLVLVTDNADVISDLTALTAATDDFRNGVSESIEFGAFDYSGMLFALNEDELSHLYSWALANGMFGAETADDVAVNIIPYKICGYNRSGGLPLLIGGCAGFLLFAVLVIVLMKQRVNTEDEEDEDDINNVKQ